MGIKKQGDRYQVRVVKKKVFEDRELAVSYDASMRQALYSADRDFGQGLVHSSVITPEKIEDFIEYKRIESRLTEQTLRNYQKRLNYIVGLLECDTLQDITREDITRLKKTLSQKPGQSRRHQQGEGLSPDTVNQYIQVFRQYINYARNIRYEVRSMLPCETMLTPIRTKEKIPGGRYMPEVLYPAEIVELLGLVKNYNLFVWAVMVAVWCTARRPAQLSKICWRDYTPPLLNSPGVMRIPEGKGGYSSSIPVSYNGTLHKVIDELESAQKKTNLGGYLFCTPTGRKWETHYLGARFRCAVRGHEKYGWITPYIVKHSAITHLQECDGITPAMVQKQAGHSRITSQEAYTHRDRTQFDLSVRVLEEVFINV